MLQYTIYFAVFRLTCFIVAENLVIQKFKKRLGTHEIESKDLQIQEPIAEGTYV